MSIYYNEIDPDAAAWLQALMDADAIPRGEIDTRSIEDVTPNDVRGYTQCHFFAGIGGWAYALDLAGWPRSRSVWTGSCPCQPFSAAGKGTGFADERHLWPAWQHLIAQCAPPVVFGEQVASKHADAWIDLVHADMEGLGYAFGCIPFPAAGIGAPHIRDRNYWCGVGLADADNTRLEGWRLPAERAAELTAGTGGLASGLAYADGGHASAEREQRGGQQRQQQAHGGPVRLADSDCRKRDGVSVLRRDERDGQDAGWPQGGSGATARVELGGMADTGLLGIRRGQSGGVARTQEARAGEVGERQWLRTDAEHGGARDAACATNGHWRDADWLGCRDGKWRPVEPGTQPLAHGLPARVGRLRGYGNAIVPQAAAAFVSAYMASRAQQMQEAA